MRLPIIKPLLVSDSPQFLGGNPQGVGERRDRDSSGASNGALEVVRDVRGANRRELTKAQKVEDEEYFFVKLLIGLGLLALLHAINKRC